MSLIGRQKASQSGTVRNRSPFGLVVIALTLARVGSSAQAPPPARYGTLDNVITRTLLEEACDHLSLGDKERERAQPFHDEYFRRIMELQRRAEVACEKAGDEERRQLSADLDNRMLRGESLRPSQDPALAAQVQRLSDLAHEVKVVRHRFLIECDAATSGFIAQLATVIPLTDDEAADLGRFFRRSIFLDSAAGGQGDLLLEFDLLKEFDRAIQPGGALSTPASNVDASARLEEAASRYEHALDQLLQHVHARVRLSPEWLLVVNYEPDFEDAEYLERRKDQARRAQRLIAVQTSFIDEVASIAEEFEEAEAAHAWTSNMQALFYPAFQRVYAPDHLREWLRENLALSVEQIAAIDTIYAEMERERDVIRPRIFEASLAVASDGDAHYGPQPPVHPLNCALGRHIADFHRAGARALTAILRTLDTEQRAILIEYLTINVDRQPGFGPFMDGRTTEAIGALEELLAIDSLAAFGVPG
jgi:hypothetical protein